MTRPPSIALLPLVVLVFTFGSSARANVLRTKDGIPVTTQSGTCVQTGADGAGDCASTSQQTQAPPEAMPGVGAF